MRFLVTGILLFAMPTSCLEDFGAGIVPAINGVQALELLTDHEKAIVDMYDPGYSLAQKHPAMFRFLVATVLATKLREMQVFRLLDDASDQIAAEKVYRKLFRRPIDKCILRQVGADCLSLEALLGRSTMAKGMFIKYGLSDSRYPNHNALLAKVVGYDYQVDPERIAYAASLPLDVICSTIRIGVELNEIQPIIYALEHI